MCEKGKRDGILAQSFVFVRTYGYHLSIPFTMENIAPTWVHINYMGTYSTRFSGCEYVRCCTPICIKYHFKHIVEKKSVEKIKLPLHINESTNAFLVK